MDDTELHLIVARLDAGYKKLEHVPEKLEELTKSISGLVEVFDTFTTATTTGTAILKFIGTVAKWLASVGTALIVIGGLYTWLKTGIIPKE